LVVGKSFSFLSSQLASDGRKNFGSVEAAEYEFTYFTSRLRSGMSVPFSQSRKGHVLD
jgi:hypothetical protein